MKRIRLVLLDVDGVLTTGGIAYTGSELETKVFNVKDGLGIRLLMRAGIGVGIVTGRRSAALDRRCSELGIKLMFDGVSDKGAVLAQVLSATGLSVDEVAFMGDDLPDIPLLRKVGFGVAVADAAEQVKHAADIVTEKNGGCGAVRELSESILRAKGVWDELIAVWD
ncbi:MAG: HAD hydrolase family protein [Deltaproteobacteria bacterium]|nr:HAD hydrolase family protein [Deltaproteobacteria bacterium]